MPKSENRNQDIDLNVMAPEASEPGTFMSITEAAEKNGVTRQAIYVAIKLKKLKARKDSARWEIDANDLDEYYREKYSRTKSRYQGELIYDESKGLISINQVARKLGVPAQKIYYATRSGLLQAHRKGAAWVVSIDDMNEYKEKYLTRKANAKIAD